MLTTTVFTPVRYICYHHSIHTSALYMLTTTVFTPVHYICYHHCIHTSALYMLPPLYSHYCTIYVTTIVFTLLHYICYHHCIHTSALYMLPPLYSHQCTIYVTTTLFTLLHYICYHHCIHTSALYMLLPLYSHCYTATCFGPPVAILSSTDTFCEQCQQSTCPGVNICCLLRGSLQTKQRNLQSFLSPPADAHCLLPLFVLQNFVFKCFFV